MLGFLALVLANKEYIDLPPASETAVLVSGCVDRLVLQGIAPAFRDADVYIWLTRAGLKPFDLSHAGNGSRGLSDFAIADAVKSAAEQVNGSVRFLSFENEVDVDVGQEVKGRMYQFNVWRPRNKVNGLQAKAILRRWNSAGYLYNKTRGYHKRVLWLREDVAPVARIDLKSTGDVTARPCRPFGGVSDKVLLFRERAAASVLPSLVRDFLSYDPGVLLGRNPEIILNELFGLKGLNVTTSKGLAFSDAMEDGEGICFKPKYLCRAKVRVCAPR